MKIYFSGKSGKKFAQQCQTALEALHLAMAATDQFVNNEKTVSMVSSPLSGTYPGLPSPSWTYNQGCNQNSSTWYHCRLSWEANVGSIRIQAGVNRYAEKNQPSADSCRLPKFLHNCNTKGLCNMRHQLSFQLFLKT